MIKPLDEGSFYRLATDVAEDRFDAQPAREREEIGALLQDFARRSGDLADPALAWLQKTHPDLFEAIKGIEPAVLSDGLDHPEALAPAIQKIAKSVDEHRSGTLWDELGFSTMYEDLSRQLYSTSGWKFLQKIDGEIRFAMPSDGWRGVIEGNEGRYVTDDLQELLKKLGVAHPDVRGEGFALWSRAQVVHMPAADAALIMDLLLLRPRTALLYQDPSWICVRRDNLPGVGPEQNCFVMPVEGYLGMRGVSEEVAELEAKKPGTPKEQLILDAVNDRLASRGAENLTASLVDRDGKRCIILSAQQASILLAVADRNEVALARHRLDYDPTVKDFDARMSNLCFQAQELAYWPADSVRDYAKAWGFEDATLLDIPATDAQMMIGYDVERNTIVAAGRGTESFKDMLADMNPILVDARHVGIPGRVPSGFLKQFESLLPSFDAKFQEYTGALAEKRKAAGLPEEPPKIVLAGHSLGASLAAMLYLRLTLHQNIPVHHAYTCGWPNTFEKALATTAAAVAKEKKTVFVRYINADDPVPLLPTNAQNEPLGFRIHFDRFGRPHPQNAPQPPDPAEPDDGVFGRISRTLRNVRERADAHRLPTYFVVVGKALRDGFTCSVWDD